MTLEMQKLCQYLKYNTTELTVGNLTHSREHNRKVLSKYKQKEKMFLCLEIQSELQIKNKEIRMVDVNNVMNKNRKVIFIFLN